MATSTIAYLANPATDREHGDLEHTSPILCLSRIDLLETLSSEDLEWLSNRLPEICLNRDQLLYTPEYRGEVIFLLLEGRVRLYKMVEAQELTLDIVEAGSVFGTASLAQRPQWSYAEALEPSRVGLLGLHILRHLVVRHPQVGLKAIELLAERLYHRESKLADIGLKEVPARLASLLLHLLEREGLVSAAGYKIATRYTHEQLATMVGARRVAVTRAFGKLQNVGAVKQKRRHIYIKDRGTLERIAKRDKKTG